MTHVTSAAEVAGLILLAVALTLANLRRTAARRARRRPVLRVVRSTSPAGPRAAGATAAAGPDLARPALSLVAGRTLVEDRVPGPAALQLEEPVRAGDKQHAIPQPRSVLASRDW
jgi:hypothetical protein